MKIFSVGPVQMHERTYKIKQKVIPYFRTQEFSDLVLDTERKLIEAIGANKESRALFLTCSGTGAMEASVINCFDENDKVLVIVGGAFGERFAQICDVHNIPHTNCYIGNGEKLTEEKLKQYDNQGFTGFLVNLDETSTCHLYNIDVIKAFCNKNNLYLVVDAISTFLCDKYKMEDYGIDLSIVTANKGLSVSPGIACVVLNQRMINKIKSVNPKTVYFNYLEYLSNGERGQTPFTPAIGTLYEINDILHFFLDYGIDRWVQKVGENALYFRKELLKIGCSYPTSYPLSNIATLVHLPKPLGRELFDYLKNTYGIFINLSGNDKTNHTVRVCHAGDLNIADFEDLISKINVFLNNN